MSSQSQKIVTLPTAYSKQGEPANRQDNDHYSRSKRQNSTQSNNHLKKQNNPRRLRNVGKAANAHYFCDGMTANEALCLRALKQWQRRALNRQLFQAWRFPIARKEEWLAWNNPGRAIYVLLALIGLPVLCLAWLIRGLVSMAEYPFLYTKVSLSPRQVRSPGERNIQGIHNAFLKQHELPVDFYLNCIDDCINILYGKSLNFSIATGSQITIDKSVINVPSIKTHIDPLLINYQQKRNKGDENTVMYVKSQIARAREEISRELGHYR